MKNVSHILNMFHEIISKTQIIPGSPGYTAAFWGHDPARSAPPPHFISFLDFTWNSRNVRARMPRPRRAVARAGAQAPQPAVAFARAPRIAPGGSSIVAGPACRGQALATSAAVAPRRATVWSTRARCRARPPLRTFARRCGDILLLRPTPCGAAVRGQGCGFEHYSSPRAQLAK